MKLIKYAVAAAIALTYGNAFAFHSGGVAECEGCHSMHNSYEGAANVTGGTMGPYLLKAQDQSGACLNCHQAADTAPTGYHISTAGIAPYDATTPVEMTPGGDFAWLKKTMTITVRGRVAANGNPGERHGHNIVAVDFGYAADSVQSVAPGGSYPNTSLACSSCHDPHGRYRRLADGTVGTTGLPIFNSGSYHSSADPQAGISAVGVYRILGGAGYLPKSMEGSGVPAFTAPAPDAVAPSSYNRSEAASITAVAYGRSMSEWCGNCHTAMHNDTYVSGSSGAGIVHPAGDGANLTAPIVANYNAYVSSGIMTGTAATAYSSLVPYEIGVADSSIASYATLKTFANPATTTRAGASIDNNVACLSCHRAHATGFESMLRFFYLNEFMTVADATGAAAYDSSTTENKINYGYNVTQQQNAYNGRAATAFGPYARSQCNKCHAKD